MAELLCSFSCLLTVLSLAFPCETVFFVSLCWHNPCSKVIRVHEDYAIMQYTQTVPL